jgi:perosamine synthetase
MEKFIPVAVPNFFGNEKKYVNDCIDTTWISSKGKYITKFEDSFANYMGSKNAISCCNGTVALHLPLMALGLKEGDEVIVPSFTYIATANAVRYCGAKPVFADCLYDTWNIDPDDILRKITPKTKGIIPVHLYGNPCDMDPILEIARSNNLFVLEDAAECHGATYKSKKAGTFGDAGIFSFFGNKIITTGEGGMVVTDNLALAEKMRLLKGQGMDPKRRYWFNEVGYNYRMTNIEAAIGLAQLEKIDEHIKARCDVAAAYDKLFKGFEDYLVTQVITKNAKSVFWMYSIRLTDKSKISRDELMENLNEDGIETRPLFYPMHIMPPYYDESAKCPITEKIACNGINIPTHSTLNNEDIEYIADKIKKYVVG